MKFDLRHLVVIDDGTPFKDAFVAMYKALDLNYEILAKCNHKGLTIEHFHRFLNKAVIIAMKDRQSNDVFVPAGIVAGFEWNSAPIGGTSISRSTIAVGRELRISIDINFSALPKLTQNNAQPTIDYFGLTDCNRRISSSFLNF